MSALPDVQFAEYYLHGALTDHLRQLAAARGAQLARGVSAVLQHGHVQAPAGRQEGEAEARGPGPEHKGVHGRVVARIAPAGKPPSLAPGFLLCPSHRRGSFSPLQGDAAMMMSTFWFFLGIALVIAALVMIKCSSLSDSE